MNPARPWGAPPDAALDALVAPPEGQMNKNLVKGIVIGGVVLVAVLVWMLYSPANNANFPNGTEWVCQNPTCKNGFNLSINQLAQYNAEHRGEPIKCPKCGSPAVRAEKCVNCGKYFPAAPGSDHRCPFCGKINTPPPEE